MPSEVGYEWSGLTLQEKKSEGQAPIIFGMAVLFVFLLLAAQYESWGLPFAVLLATPTVILGMMIGMFVAQLRSERLCPDRPGHAHRTCGQKRHSHRRVRQDETRGRQAKSWMPRSKAPSSRLRPILMTSFAFILGCVPLMLATGSGAASRSTMGTGVVFGMTISTVVGLVHHSGLLCIRAGNRGARQKTKARDSNNRNARGNPCGASQWTRPQSNARRTRGRKGSTVTQSSPSNAKSNRPAAVHGSTLLFTRVLTLNPAAVGAGQGRREWNSRAKTLLSKSRLRLSSFGIFLFAVLGGCAVGPNYKRPAVDAPGTYRTAATDTNSVSSAQSFAELGWWDTFKDPQLTAYIGEALTNSWDIKIAAARVLQAEANLRIARSEYMPTVNTGGDLVGSRASQRGPVPYPANLNPQRNYGDVFVSMNAYEVDLWGRIRRANEAARPYYSQTSIRNVPCDKRSWPLLPTPILSCWN